MPSILLAFLVTIPGIFLRISGAHVGPGVEAGTYGIAILGAAFLLTWAAEVAELDVPQGVALAALALIAVLPEYAVDLYFAWRAAHHPEYTSFATANMTGANRMLIGIAWPLIIYLYWWKTRKTELVLPRNRTIELFFLSIATVYCFALPFKQTISLLDTVVLVGCFVGYMWRIAQAEAEEPDLVGPAALIGRLPPAARRTTVLALLLFAGAIILSAAEPFAESIIATGRSHHIDEFLLVQWVAPLASEAPEVLIACILTLKGDAQAGMGAMISSKLNQWTLLVGTLPLVYSISLGQPGALHLDHRQVEEILLTAAQSLFAVAVLSNMRLSIAEATALFVLFAGQLFSPGQDVRHYFSIGYVVLGVGILFLRRKRMRQFLHDGLFADHRTLSQSEEAAQD